MKIGVLGGTFNPVHLGHLILAEEASFQLKLNRVLWVLTPNPPHKSGKVILEITERLRLLELAIAENPMFALSDVDIRRPPPHFAVDTMRLLHEEFPGHELIYLIGGDSLRGLPGWFQPDALVEICDGLGVMLRPGVDVDTQQLDQQIPGILRKLIILSGQGVDISSSDIRARIINHRPYRYLLPPRVYETIRESRFYL